MPTLAMPRPVIDLREVSLCYRLAKQKIPSFKEYALHWMRGALTYEQLWALREVNLRVDRGESLGIVGRNGAGKSTLLKVISSVLPPTRGKALIHGRVAPMLELGTGFDFELTGQENIFLNALLLGHPKRVEVMEHLPFLAATGGIAETEMLRTFNCGIGMIVVVAPDKADAVTDVFRREGETVTRLGEVIAQAAGAPRVVYHGALDLAR